jgi:hypothetical protein
MTHVNAQRLGVRWPSTAFSPGRVASTFFRKSNRDMIYGIYGNALTPCKTRWPAAQLPFFKTVFDHSVNSCILMARHEREFEKPGNGGPADWLSHRLPSGKTFTRFTSPDPPPGGPLN